METCIKGVPKHYTLKDADCEKCDYRKELEDDVYCMYISKEQRHRESEETVARWKQALEILKPNIALNLRHLTFIEGTGHPPDLFHILKQERQREAKINALVSFLGNAIQWAAQDGRAISWKILEDVNLHDEASRVKDLLDGKKPNLKELAGDIIGMVEGFIHYSHPQIDLYAYKGKKKTLIEKDSELTEKVIKELAKLTA